MKRSSLALALWFGSAIIAAQTSSLVLAEAEATQGRGRQQQDEPVKLETTLVQVPVVVRDPGGRYITDLTQRDFEVFEDGVKQEIGFFGSVEEPFSVALLIDSSGSTIEQLDSIKAAATAFTRSLRPRDRVMVISFNDSVQVLCDLTGDREVLSRAIEGIQPGEFTQVYEAVYTAVWERLREIEGRKAVVVFSDGVDTASSEIAAEDTLDAVIESEDVIAYVIRYGTRPDNERKMLARMAGQPPNKADREMRKLDRQYREADEYFHQLAEYSGGVVLRADTLTELEPAFAKIADELRHQYLLGYYPTSKRGDHERRIVVRVLRPGTRVRARPSYRG
ncbi:MAG TPA: VWA domain-containing protein [Blastocatellia bacterium]|nr:VWA domain-containing protein [Blastocatellia bacterium]